MDDLQRQKNRIDEEAEKTKVETDRKAGEERQAAADREADKIRQEAEEKATQIQNDAQK
jgi:hypothetical protein